MEIFSTIKVMTIAMPDGSTWGVPVEVIAKHRAKYYADKKYDGDLDLSLEGTNSLFECDESEIEDWASNNMNWSDVVEHAKLIEAGSIDYQEGWVNG